MKVTLECLLLCFAFLTSESKPNPVPPPRHKFIVIAHRGDHTRYPENTLAAYQQAIKDGADYVEIDLRTTKDGKLVSLHNESVDRMTNSTGLVKDLTFEEIKRLKVKDENKLNDGKYEIPSFQEILKLCKNKIYIYIDFKDADPAVVYPVLKQYGMEKQVLVYINNPAQLTNWRKVAPKMPLMLSMPDSVHAVSGMSVFINQYHPDVLDGDYTQYNNQMTAFAKAQHIPVWPDAQQNNEGEKDWSKAIGKGLNGVQTDHPEALLQYLVKTGIR